MHTSNYNRLNYGKDMNSRASCYRICSCRSSVSKESAYNAEDLGLVPGSERSPGEENGNPLQCSCLENPMDKGVWQATVHGVGRVGYDLVTKPPPAVSQGCQSMTPLPLKIIKMTLL